MNEGTFSLKAGVLWGTIPQEARKRILKAVFCVKCRTSVEIVRYTGEAVCGQGVVRVVETSERDLSGN